MKIHRLTAAWALVMWMTPVASAQVQVVTTIPDLADVAKVIGGERVAKLTSLAKGTMNIHAVPLRPSKLVATSRADLFVQMGLSLEHAYVPGLLAQARNKKIRPGAPGFLNASEGWQAIEVPEVVSRGLSADLHPDGNPHFNLDPRAGRHLADRILEGFRRVDPEGAKGYEARHAAYVAELARKEEGWAALRAKLAGKRVVTYHGDFNYFLRAAGMQEHARLEPKPGLAPTPGHMAELIKSMRAEKVGVILTAKWSNNASVRFVAEKTGARVIELPTMVGGAEGADSWIEMMDLLHRTLVAAFEPPR